MGLAEKRLIQRLSAEVIPAHERELLAITGSPLSITIDWTYFLENAVASEGLEQWGLPTIAQALRRICADDVGRSALVGAVQGIRLSQWPATWPAGTIADGNLDLTWDWAGPERFSADQLEAQLSRQL